MSVAIKPIAPTVTTRLFTRSRERYPPSTHPTAMPTLIEVVSKLVCLSSRPSCVLPRALTVEATFAGAPPDVSALSGVSDVTVTGHFMSCQVHGAIDEVLTVLAAAKPQSLLSREPSLEELFLSLYGQQERRNHSADAAVDGAT